MMERPYATSIRPVVIISRMRVVSLKMLAPSDTIDGIIKKPMTVSCCQGLPVGINKSAMAAGRKNDTIYDTPASRLVR